MDFRLDQAQFVVFLSSIESSGKLKIASAVARAIGELSGVDPLMLPLPESAPQEIPRIQVQNEVAGWAFTYSPLRIDLINTPKTVLQADSLPDALSELRERAAGLWSLLTTEVSAKGSRLAQIVTLTAPVGNAAAFIRGGFLSPRAGDQLAEAQVHFLRKVDVAGLSSNRWVRMLSQEASPDRVLVLVDFNTVGERKLEVNPGMIADFSVATSKQLVEVLAETMGGLG